MAQLSKVQIVVVTCNEQRKQLLTEQLKTLMISISFTFFEGYTPQTSTSYMVDRDTICAESDGTLCCMRSHAGAIDFFVREFTDKEYLLILEDDAALIKTFESELVHIIDRLEKHGHEIDFVNLSYSNNIQPHTAEKRNKMLFWNLSQNFWGTTAYLVKRDVAVKMASVLHQPTSKDLRLSFDKYIQNELRGKSYADKHPRLQSDALLSIGWRQAVVFPVMVVEISTNSLITPKYNNIQLGVWEHVFTNGFRKKEEFYNIPISK